MNETLGFQYFYFKNREFRFFRSNLFIEVYLLGGLEMESEWIVCVQCDDEFEFSIADQIRYERKGFEPPKRCPSCRRHKSKIIYLIDRREAKNRRIVYRVKNEKEY